MLNYYSIYLPRVSLHEQPTMEHVAGELVACVLGGFKGLRRGQSKIRELNPLKPPSTQATYQFPYLKVFFEGHRIIIKAETNGVEAFALRPFPKNKSFKTAN
jgi:hypothetical protein